MVVPLAGAAIRNWCRLEHPNAMISNDKPLRTGLWTALSKRAVEWQHHQRVNGAHS